MTKTFGNNIRYAKNYLKKIRENEKIVFSAIYYGKNGWEIFYDYKK